MQTSRRIVGGERAVPGAHLAHVAPHGLDLHEDVRNEVVPGVWLGRRATPGEIEGSGVAVVLDLTSELPATARPAGVAYHLAPSLDAVGPTVRRARPGVGWRRTQRRVLAQAVLDVARA